jgi:hypothetical protein
LFSFIENEQELERTKEIENLGVEVRTVLRRPVPNRNFLLTRPKEHWEYASSQMQALVLRTFSEAHFDVVQAEFVQTRPCSKEVRR